MKKIILSCIVLITLSCNREAYVETKVSFDQVGTDCSKTKAAFKMTSNFGGERFEFQKCLPSAYDAASVTSVRKGDTVLVTFGGVTKPSALYQVVLDIDSYPSYQFITIDGETYQFTPTSE